MVQVIAIAQQLGCIRIPKNTLIETDDLRNYPDNKQTIITTGSQGESMASLTRMAEDTHRKIKIKPGDTIIFSSHPIPGNEKSVTNVINKLLVKGANVIFQDVHVSGHPCQEDLKLIYSLVKPKYAVPVHGEYRHLIAQAKIAESLGIPKENIIILRSGNVLEMDQKSAKVTGNVRANGKLTISGEITGDSVAAEIYAENARVNGEVRSQGSVKIGHHLGIFFSIKSPFSLILMKKQACGHAAYAACRMPVLLTSVGSCEFFFCLPVINECCNNLLPVVICLISCINCQSLAQSVLPFFGRHCGEVPGNRCPGVGICEIEQNVRGLRVGLERNVEAHLVARCHCINTSIRRYAPVHEVKCCLNVFRRSLAVNAPVVLSTHAETFIRIIDTASWLTNSDSA